VIQSLNQKQKVPTYSSQEWGNHFIMKSLFDFHLKRRTIINIDWYQLFVKWKEQESPLIELNIEMQKIHTENYQFSMRELAAWQSFLRAAGAHNVTPWSYKECQVFLHRKYYPYSVNNFIKKKLIINFFVSFNFGQNQAIQNKIVHYLPNYIKWEFLLKIQPKHFGSVLAMH